MNSPFGLPIRLAEFIERSGISMKLSPVAYGIKVPATVSTTLTE